MAEVVSLGFDMAGYLFHWHVQFGIHDGQSSFWTAHLSGISIFLLTFSIQWLVSFWHYRQCPVFLKEPRRPINDQLSFDLLKWSENGLWVIGIVDGFALDYLWVIVVFVILQTIGIARLMLEFYKLKNVIMNKLVSVVKWGSIFSAVAYVIKFMLQLFSVIPAFNKLAFGFGPIVIALFTSGIISSNLNHTDLIDDRTGNFQI